MKKARGGSQSSGPFSGHFPLLAFFPSPHLQAALGSAGVGRKTDSTLSPRMAAAWRFPPLPQAVWFGIPEPSLLRASQVCLVCYCPLVARSHIPDDLVLPQPWATLVHLLHTHTRLGPLGTLPWPSPSAHASGDGVLPAALIAGPYSPAMPIYQGFLL